MIDYSCGAILQHLTFDGIIPNLLALRKFQSEAIRANKVQMERQINWLSHDT